MCDTFCEFEVEQRKKDGFSDGFPLILIPAPVVEMNKRRRKEVDNAVQYTEMDGHIAIDLRHQNLHGGHGATTSVQWALSHIVVAVRAGIPVSSHLVSEAILLVRL